MNIENLSKVEVLLAEFQINYEKFNQIINDQLLMIEDEATLEHMGNDHMKEARAQSDCLASSKEKLKRFTKL